MGHGDLGCIFPIAGGPLEVEGEFRKSRKSTATMQRARGDQYKDVERTSRTYVEGGLAVCRPLEESFTFLSTARDALVALLCENGKDWQAECLMQGELVELDFRSCQIGDNGAEIVADFLKHDKTVTKVWMYDCDIRPQGVKAIAESLKHNRTAELLNLFTNPIGDEGADALIDALSYNVLMKLLIVSRWSIAPKLCATIEYLTKTRNKILIPSAVRHASLFLIAARRNIADAGNLAIFPKEIVKMIAMEVWATRKEPIWIDVLTESERTGE